MNDRWGRRLFVAGGIVLVVLGLVHSLSLIQKPVPSNETEKQLLGLMTSYKFNLMGSMRSMDNLLRGFSMAFTLASLAMGGIAMAVRRERSGLLKRVALCNVLWLAAMTAVSLIYFFAAPTSFLVLAWSIFAAAWVMLARS